MIKKENFGLLESTLNPVTLRYLNSKYQVNDNNELLEKKDLRHMCENVLKFLINYVYMINQ